MGSIKLDFDEDVVTNRTLNTDPFYYDKSYLPSMKGPLSNFAEIGKPYAKKSGSDEGIVNFKKGEMTGRFEMGSTIVLMWESPKNTCVHVVEGQKLSLGQKLVTTGK